MSKSNTRVAAYIRVSTEHQTDSGVSLEAQEAKLRAYALALDLELVAIKVDAGLSAKNMKRPGLQAALAMLDAGKVDGLLVAKLDRLTRSVRDLGWLLEPSRFGGRWSLLSVNDSIDTRTAAGRLVLHVLGAVSQWEREATGERTREALQHKRSASRDTNVSLSFNRRRRLMPLCPCGGLASARGAGPCGSRCQRASVRPRWRAR